MNSADLEAWRNRYTHTLDRDTRYKCRNGHKHPTIREAIECVIDSQEGGP